MQQRSANREQQLDRRRFIGGSDARIITGQDEKALIRLWQEKRGEVGPEDLSVNLIVQFGVATKTSAPIGGVAAQTMVRLGAHYDSVFFLLLLAFRKRTPAPPPFSSMNSAWIGFVFANYGAALARLNAQVSWHGRRQSSFLCLAKSHAGAAAVFLNELNTRCFNRFLDPGTCLVRDVRSEASFQTLNRRDRQTGFQTEFGLRPS
jgi:hypothetical protein